MFVYANLSVQFDINHLWADILVWTESEHGVFLMSDCEMSTIEKQIEISGFMKEIGLSIKSLLNFPST